ncbi:antibiotic biosynthesis monooxygenase [Sandaracinobacter sp. RS1-74]|uniref:antibiotic biosynthesis monooxygenase n=1 Tax=Sandaracinobacteroides sayramensis TaxID=2913411 RepID=UPI001EDB91AC|nr:antibiotic biosynthesis monooxygenase [Sandaracinobacteroides sayramensis]MCG2840945.1 antibiotic biosynthesis monooxygenase [Sandaracinobacteroides sayramensis]
MGKIYGFGPIDIHEGQEEAFIEAARACHEAILPDLTGTRYYEWFLSADGRNGYVIELYDDPEAVALHGRMLDGRVAKVLQHATLRIEFAGEVPQILQDRMRERLGAVGYIGPRAFGLIEGPSPHRHPPSGDERILALAWFRPHDGQAEALSALARESFEQASAKDPGTLAYEWFPDGKGNWFAFDAYQDAEAMLAHMANCGPIMGRILAIADSETLLFGTLPPAMEARLRPELGIRRFPRRLHGVG